MPARRSAAELASAMCPSRRFTNTGCSDVNGSISWRVGSARDGKVALFVPGHQTDNPDGAAGEGIVADVAGNLYAAENTLKGVTKYAKR